MGIRWDIMVVGIIAALFLWTSVATFRRDRRFRRDGVQTSGHIIRLGRRGLGKEGQTAYAEVEFTEIHSGQPIRFRTPVSSPSAYVIGQVVPVVYLPTTPTTAKILVSRFSPEWLAMLIFSLLCWGYVIFVLVVALFGGTFSTGPTSHATPVLGP